MSFNLRAAVLLFALIIVGSVHAYAQSVRGKVIYVSSMEDVKLKFRSTVSNYSFVNKSQSSAFKIKTSGKSVHVKSVLETSKPVNLVVTEGSNTHLFILSYRSSSDASTETVYDFSSKGKLQQETQKVIVKKPAEPVVQNVQVKNTPVEETHTIVTQAVITTEAKERPVNKTEPAQIVTDIPERPQTTASAEPENNKQITSVSTAPAKTKEVNAGTTTYSSEIAKGTVAFKEKNYRAARSYFQSAQKMNPTAKYPKMRLAEIDKLMRGKRK